MNLSDLFDDLVRVEIVLWDAVDRRVRADVGLPLGRVEALRVVATTSPCRVQEVAVTLRITRVRDVNGVIWHIRNGTISKSGNESHGWARAVVDVPAPPELDLPDTRKIMGQAAAAMWHERRWRKLMMEKPEVWGVQAITDTQVTMRVAAKTLPLRQYEVGRELRERVVSAIDLALLDLQMDPQPGRTAAQLAAVGEETRRPKPPRTTMRSRTGHAGGDDPISDEIEPKSQDS